MKKIISLMLIMAGLLAFTVTAPASGDPTYAVQTVCAALVINPGMATNVDYVIDARKQAKVPIAIWTDCNATNVLATGYCVSESVDGVNYGPSFQLLVTATGTTAWTHVTNYTANAGYIKISYITNLNDVTYITNKIVYGIKMSSP
jgi:hypothetical protein